MSAMQRLLAVSMLAGLLLCLVQVWVPAVYVTGDGPSVVYNARMLHDVWAGHDVAFYKQYYDLLYTPNPNWVSHIIVALLMFVVNGIVAEKILLSLYILLFTSGFYMLLNEVNKKMSFWVLCVFFAVFHHALSKGFYNYSLSIGFYFWMVWSWLKFIDKKSPLNGVLFFASSGLLFFTHLLPFVFGVVTCGGLAASYALCKGYAQPHRRWTFFARNTLALLILLGPFLYLSQMFTEKEGGLRMTLYPHPYRLIELVEFKYMVMVSWREASVTALAGITVSSLMLLVFIRRIKDGLVVHKYDGFLVALVFVGFVYMFFPEEFMGRMILISLRAQVMLYILMACCIAYTLPETVKNVCGVILMACFVALALVRMPVLQNASDAAEDIVSAGRYIRPNSIVFPFNFAPGGKDREGHKIADANWLFVHTAQYIGAIKPLIFTDNYEAQTGYFPFCWREKTSPYLHLSRHEGMESAPPAADIAAYEAKTGAAVDYVLMWCYDSTMAQQGHYPQLAAQVREGYHLIYTSVSRRTMLYERNNTPIHQAP